MAGSKSVEVIIWCNIPSYRTYIHSSHTYQSFNISIYMLIAQDMIPAHISIEFHHQLVLAIWAFDVIYPTISEHPNDTASVVNCMTVRVDPFCSDQGEIWLLITSLLIIELLFKVVKLQSCKVARIGTPNKH